MDDTFKGRIIFIGLFDGVPNFDLFGFFFRKVNYFVLIVPIFHHHFNGIIQLGTQITFLIHEFMDSNLPFRFVTNVNQHMIFVDGDNLTSNHLTFFKLLEALLVHRHEAFHVLIVHVRLSIPAIIFGIGIYRFYSRFRRGFHFL